MNGLVRQYIPKQREFASITEYELLVITNRLNHRPRKCLDFLSPFEVFFELPVALGSWIQAKKYNYSLEFTIATPKPVAAPDRAIESQIGSHMF
jgi:hypothetical protein